MVNQGRALRLLGSAIVFLVAFLLMFAAMSVKSNAQESGASNRPAMTQEQIEQKKQELEQKLKEKREQLEQEKQQREQERQKKAEERKAQVSAKLEENKLKACEKREESINKRMQRIGERVSKQVEVFNKISERTQQFYTDKGLTVENYDVLVSDVAAKKNAVTAAVENLKTSTVDFKCESDDPLGVAEAFKGAREEVSVAMKEYKTSIKDLIVAVKTAAELASNTTEGQE